MGSGGFFLWHGMGTEWVGLTVRGVVGTVAWVVGRSGLWGRGVRVARWKDQYGLGGELVWRFHGGMGG
jgi:hypothetical protein